MRIRPTIPTLLLTAVLCVFPHPADAQTKSDTKHPALDGLTDIGPDAKRQAGYGLTEVLQYFDRIDKLIESDNTTKSHMDNAFNRATARSVEQWDTRGQKVLDAYVMWLQRSKGQKAKALPDDWRAFYARIQKFLDVLDNEQGPRAIAWRRELNVVEKRFGKYARVAPNVMEGYKVEVDYAVGELREARTTLRKSVTTLDDLKQRRRHLVRARTTIKNLQDVMVEQQKLAVEVFSDGNKAYSPKEFEKGVKAIEAWKNQCAGDDQVSPAAKQLTEHWAKTALSAWRKYVVTYNSAKGAMSAFQAGKLFDDEFFSGVKYDRMVDVIDKMIEQLDARIQKITG